MDPRDAGREYIEQMRAEGYSEMDIRAALEDAGWTEEQILRVMAPEEEGPPPPPPKQERERAPARAKSSDSTMIWILVAVGCLGMLVLVGAVMAAITFPVFFRAREKATQSSCLANIKQMSLAHLMYAQDYGETFTPASGWPDRTFPYIKNSGVFLCPQDERTNPPTFGGGPVSYTMNSAVDGMALKQIGLPANVPLIYDGNVLVGGVGDVAFRHNNGANCGYVDGHAKWVDQGSWNTGWVAPTAPPPGGMPAPPQPAPPTPPAPPVTQPGAVLEMSPHERARSSACQSNLKQVSTAMLMYVADYDGMAPSADRWPEVLYPYMRNREILICPSDEATHRSGHEGWEISYTMNDALNRAMMRGRPRPSQEVMLFDGSMVRGGAEAADFRHVGGLNVGYADGHVSRVEESAWAGVWSPAGAGAAAGP